MPVAVVAAYSAFVAWGATSLTAAIVVGAVQGAVVGCVIGAGVAAATGGDIGKGALYGALAGAVIGGFGGGIAYEPASAVAGGVGGASGGSGGAAASTSAAPATAAPATTTTTATAAAPAATTGNFAVNAPQAGMTVQEAQIASRAADLAAAQSARTAAGLGQGAAIAVGQVGASMIEEKGEDKRSKKEIEAEKALASERFSRETERIAGNIPGQFEAQTANVEIPEWWNKHLIDERINRGLLEPAAAPIVPIPVGV